MRNSFCPLCRSKKKTVIWNGKIRFGKKWTKQNHKIFKCRNCSLGYLKKRQSFLEDNKIFRKIFDGDNSVLKYKSFNQPREIKKLKKIQKIINFKNKSILESNCGAASILDYLSPQAKLTAGIDSYIYKRHVEKKHLFFSNFRELITSKKKFDIILSLAELEHKKNPISFIKQLKKVLKKNGKIIFRIPNYNNIYMFLLGYDFLKYDFRLSHNYYFDESSLDYLFDKLKMKIIFKTGLQEYSINHLIEYIKTSKRVEKSYRQIIPIKKNNKVEENLETSKTSTSLLYIVTAK